MIWSSLKRAIDRGVEHGVRQAMDQFTAPGGKLDEMILAELKKPENRWFWFVKAMQAKMMTVDPAMDGKLAYDVAVSTLRDFLRDEKIKFGDPDYDWSDAGARDLIQAMEIDHWESAA